MVIEWSDLDPRLGLRSAGGWTLSRQADILENCQARFIGLLSGLTELAGRMPVALVPPTLSAPLLGHTPGWQASLAELELQRQLATFLSEAVRVSRMSVLNSQRLGRASVESSRLDALMELKAGFPYTTPHASAVAEMP